jgi:hypothetical protein
MNKGKLNTHRLKPRKQQRSSHTSHPEYGHHPFPVLLQPLLQHIEGQNGLPVDDWGGNQDGLRDHTKLFDGLVAVMELRSVSETIQGNYWIAGGLRGRKPLCTDIFGLKGRDYSIVERFVLYLGAIFCES